MGPRLDRRGNERKTPKQVLLDGASMGPRLDRRGNDLRIPYPRCIGLLQWGHAWIGVGIGGPTMR